MCSSDLLGQEQAAEARASELAANARLRALLERAREFVAYVPSIAEWEEMSRTDYARRTVRCKNLLIEIDAELRGKDERSAV